MSERTITVTVLAAMTLAMLALVSPGTLAAVAATSAAWLLAIWFVFYRKPRKEKHGNETFLR